MTYTVTLCDWTFTWVLVLYRNENADEPPRSLLPPPRLLRPHG
jgi:hypothetical protein